jgi:hypothetical protein
MQRRKLRSSQGYFIRKHHDIGRGRDAYRWVTIRAYWPRRLATGWRKNSGFSYYPFSLLIINLCRRELFSSARLLMQTTKVPNVGAMKAKMLRVTVPPFNDSCLWIWSETRYGSTRFLDRNHDEISKGSAYTFYRTDRTGYMVLAVLFGRLIITRVGWLVRQLAQISTCFYGARSASGRFKLLSAWHSCVR